MTHRFAVESVPLCDQAKMPVTMAAYDLRMYVGEELEARSAPEHPHPFLGPPTHVLESRSPAELWQSGSLGGGGLANQLMRAVLTAFDRHLPLVLSPDHVWTAVLQGVSHHVSLNPEAARHVLVSHPEGKVTLGYQNDTFVRGSPDNDWSLVVQSLVGQVVDLGGTGAAAMRRAQGLRFSTTTPAQRVAADAAILDTCKAFYDYKFTTCCGIPWIEVRGTPQDWAALAGAAAELLGQPGLRLEPWAARLKPVFHEFGLAAQGRGGERTRFWSGILDREGPWGSGGGEAHVSGWLSVLYPYLDTGKRNPAVWGDPPGPGQGPEPRDFPCGLTATPFDWEYYGESIKMRLRAGFVGVALNESGALVPEIGWYVLSGTEEWVEPVKEGKEPSRFGLLSQPLPPSPSESCVPCSVM